ncbi:MAG: TraX family protein [Lachnospiraceae bacterium]|nr:TraX family protein [Lachnospiraceae bacterium]
MEKYRIFNAAQLKYLAAAAMLLDHLALALQESLTPVLFDLLRGISRTAFPLFAFFIVEGFLNTGHFRSYLGRMLLFACLSELPYDLLVYGRPFASEGQNVLLTFVIGLMMLRLILMYQNRPAAIVLITGAAAGLAFFLKTDYDIAGILLILLFFLFRENRPWQCLAGAVVMSWEWASLPSFLLIGAYNGCRGRQNRWFFYLFYPVHMLLLYGLSRLAG